MLNSKYNKRLMLTLLLIAILSMLVAVWALFFRNDTEVIAPDRVPAIEHNSEKIPDDNTEKTDVPAGGGAVSLSFSKDVSVDLDDNIAKLYFASPNKSSHDIVLQIIVRDSIIAQSGKISPGNQVKELELMDGISGMLSEGGYDGKFMVHYYDRANGAKDSVNTEIPINIKVN